MINFWMVEGYRSFFAHLEKSTKLFQFEWKWHCLNCRAENWPTPVALRRALGWLDKLWMRLALTELSDRGPCVYIYNIYICVGVYMYRATERESSYVKLFLLQEIQRYQGWVQRIRAISLFPGMAVLSNHQFSC